MIKKLFSFLTSMSTAVLLLLLVAVASAIGSFIEQDLPEAIYHQRLGPHTFTIAKHLGFFHLYSTLWFIGILCFLTVSTTLCVSRRLYATYHSWKTAHPDMVNLPSIFTYPIQATYAQVQRCYTKAGYPSHLYYDTHTQITTLRTQNTAAYQWGYFLIHIAMLALFLIALLNSAFIYRLSIWLHPPQKHQLRFDRGHSFRANVTLTQDQPTHTGTIMLNNEAYEQELPIEITLLHFYTHFYPDGSPLSYASELLLRQGSHTHTATLSVNTPIHDHHLMLYQTGYASVYDHLRIHLWNLATQKQSTHTIDLNNYYRWSPPTLIGIGTLEEHTRRLTPSVSASALHRLLLGTNNEKENHTIDLGPVLHYSIDDSTTMESHYESFIRPYAGLGTKWAMWSVAEHNQRFYILAPLSTTGDLTPFFSIAHWLYAPKLWPTLINKLIEHLPAHQARLWSNAAQHLLYALKKGRLSDLFNTQGSYPPKIKTAMIYLIKGLLQTAWSLSLSKTPIASVDNQHFLNAMVYAVTAGRALSLKEWITIEHYQQHRISYLQVRYAYADSGIILSALLLILGLFLMTRSPRQGDVVSWSHDDGHGCLHTQKKINTTHPLYMLVLSTLESTNPL